MKHTLMSIALISIASAAFAGPSATGITTPAANTNQVVCDGDVAGGGKMSIFGGSGAVIDGAAAVFIRNGFDFQCSANTWVKFVEVDTNLAAVGSGSVKGNQSYGGHTNGGAIGPSAQCSGTNQACTSDDVDTAVEAAVSAGGGST